ncbi:DUF4153 domain-containing protein [Ruegeria atlantica]|uniref:DUF4153 domain-containing protein n=1 Tax=Ruegeria atlantica TaxID=81569 RepID=UPI00147F961E|nr:DUF4173 domain-containing protein [Ruegeria atlantica]
MSGTLVINGVPDSIRHDGWWLACSHADAPGVSGTQEKIRPKKVGRRHSIAIIVLLLMVILADWLFWGHSLGISVALFALALSVAILAMKPSGATPREWVIALAFATTCNLPVVEQFQMLSLFFAGIGIVVLVVWVSYGRIVKWWQALWTITRVSTVGATLLPIGLVDDVKEVQATARLKQHLKALILPLAVGLMFLLLLALANPILERFLDQLARLEFLTTEHALRIFFWVVVASVVWPYLNLSESWLGPVASTPKFKSIHLPRLASLVSAESVRNSLFLFNILFFVQTVMDIGVLTGGMSLPDGMTYARYAHRGAYPLLATALLAGVFAITTHQMIGESRFLKSLLLLWLGQNLFLVFTAAFRLNLYVEAYNLTYLRVGAFVWMGLVFVGLILTVAQITRAYSVGWLVRSNLAVLMGTLYLCSFVNFAWVIADYNLHHSNTIGRLDTRYVCGLGELALPAILEHHRATGESVCNGYQRQMPVHSPINNWRDWGFREWRLQVYLAAELQEQVIDARPYSHR